MFNKITSKLQSVHGKSFILGLIVAWLPFIFAAPLGAWDWKQITNVGKQLFSSVEVLAGIKSGLDQNVSQLRGDASNLITDASNLLVIKQKLVTLSEETQSQIASINSLVGVVEDHIKDTETHISDTAKNVAKIDEVRRSLESNK
jgi:hypothetical protein